MATILEGLQNAQINLCVNMGAGVAGIFGRDQLTNAVKLLEKGYPLETEIEPLLVKHGGVDQVPELPGS